MQNLLKTRSKSVDISNFDIFAVRLKRLASDSAEAS
jgi:hypothetical protein